MIHAIGREQRAPVFTISTSDETNNAKTKETNHHEEVIDS